MISNHVNLVILSYFIFPHNKNSHFFYPLRFTRSGTDRGQKARKVTMDSYLIMMKITFIYDQQFTIRIVYSLTINSNTL